MTLTLNLPADVEQRLMRTAQQQGLPADACALKRLDENLPGDTKRRELADLIQSWIDVSA